MMKRSIAEICNSVLIAVSEFDRGRDDPADLINCIVLKKRRQAALKLDQELVFWLVSSVEISLSWLDTKGGGWAH